MKLRLNDDQEEREKEAESKGLSKNSATKENVYGIELPIAVCSPFNALVIKVL